MSHISTDPAQVRKNIAYIQDVLEETDNAESATFLFDSRDFTSLATHLTDFEKTEGGWKREKNNVTLYVMFR